MDTTTIESALARAIEIRPHYIHLITQLHPLPMPGSGTINADRFMRLYFDAKAIAEWELDWAAARILVQIEHFVRRHAARQKGREQITWDFAAEIACTSTLYSEGVKLHPQSLSPETFGLEEGRSAEFYAQQLLKMCMKRRDSIGEGLATIIGGNLPDFGSAGGENLKDWELPEDADVPTVDYLLALMLQQAMEPEETIPGEGSCDHQRMVRKKRKSTTDWRLRLRNIMGKTISTLPGMADYSFLMPDTDPGMNKGMIMPGMIGLKADIALVIDTSGSMGERRLAQALAETEGILKTTDGSGGVRVYSCDTAVKTSREISHIQQVNMVGGGGTNMGTGIDAAASQHPRPDVIVVVTDCDTPWPRDAPRNIRVIVVALGKGKIPKWVNEVVRVPVGYGS